MLSLPKSCFFWVSFETYLEMAEFTNVLTTSPVQLSHAYSEDGIIDVLSILSMVANLIFLYPHNLIHNLWTAFGLFCHVEAYHVMWHFLHRLSYPLQTMSTHLWWC